MWQWTSFVGHDLFPKVDDGVDEAAAGRNKLSTGEKGRNGLVVCCGL